ncbi:DUF4352 domain-containing protein [Streptomyces sp. NPDC002122]|uniref:DUF4352 domain-containing protein n=1 Tax=Streptomyces sp. NPDC002122 TaxID=3154407 RepID=UPI00332CA07B
MHRHTAAALLAATLLLTGCSNTSDAPSPGATAQAAGAQVTATKTTFTPGIAAVGTDYTTLKVTITNTGTTPIKVNPLYFAIVDTTKAKHAVSIGTVKGEIATMELAPGENTTGTIAAEGTFTPDYVTWTSGYRGPEVRASVS